jgi:N-acetyl-gamma-glutamylphosphate reductase
MKKNGEIVALPKGICKPLVDATDCGGKKKPKTNVVLDSSADYSFNSERMYGLLGESRPAHISNPYQQCN